MATAGSSRGAGPERAFVAPLPESGTVSLDREEGHHLVRVRRVRRGDEVVLFDGEGGTRLARLVDPRADAPVLEVLGPYPDREPARAVVVAAALPGAGRAADMLFALAEIGVRAFVPLRCERSTLDAGDLLERRGERFARLVREAAKVSGRSRLLRLEAPRAPAEVAGPSAVILDTDPALPRLAAVLGPALEAPAPDPGETTLLVGPEGGFTPAEIAAVLAAGGRAASLGTCALRTETAALAAAAVALGR